MSGVQNKIHPSTIITAHLNADFDALSSALAASKLYPDAVIVLPGSQERGLREFFLKSGGYFIDVKKMKDVELDRLKRLVIVDTRQKGRLGLLAELVDRPGIELHVFDHHPSASGDIEATHTIFRPVGANVTIMVDILRDKGLPISPDEATFLALGIYEDTGSFTFNSTTPDDLRAAAWLLEKGADLKTISELLGHRFTPEHVGLLDDLLSTAATYTMAGIPITVAKTSSPNYVEDFAVLAHELMDMEKLPVVFALALMGEQVLVVGRSRIDAVDVGKVLRALGGGGHPMAASASLKGVTLAEAEEMLVSELQRQIGTQPKVKDIMSRPVISVGPQTPLYEVHDILTRYGISVVPVVKKGKVSGLISRRTVEKAIYHGLAKLPVSEYMSTDFRAVAPEDTFDRVQELIIENRQRFVPVVDNGKITGVITRTDLLQILGGDPSRQPEPLLSTREQRRNISSLLREKLPDRILDLLRSAGEVADQMGCQVYVVGGFVRDLLLRRQNYDIDLVVEGDGIAFAERFAAKYGGKVRAHEKFGTAVIILPDGFKVDVATARLEYYEYPAAMPTVALSSIKLDLFRRDFTINTLAVKLNPKEFGLMIDFFGGQRDIKDRIIRVLHSLSFVEDPTRVFRAVRFEQRFGFSIGKHTLRLIKNAVSLDIFSRLSGKRLLTELRLILEEQDPRPVIRRMAQLDLLRAIHPAIRYTARLRKVLDRTYDVLTWYELLYRTKRPEKWMVYLMALLSGLKREQLKEALDRLGLSGRRYAIFTDGVFMGLKALDYLTRKKDLRPSQVFLSLRDLKLEVLLYLMARTDSEQARHRISRFITEFRRVRPILSGKDLKALGLEPGPVFRKILERLRLERLDGRIKTRADEISLARSYLKA